MHRARHQAPFLVGSWLVIAVSAGCGSSGGPAAQPDAAGGGASGSGGAGAGGSGGTPDTRPPGTGGGGGSPDGGGRGRDAARPDAAIVPPAAGDGGVSASVEVIAACTPQMATVTIQQPDSGGGMVFRSMIPDPEATFRQIALKVCTTLYDMPGAVRRQNAITLVIQDPGNGVAATGGSRINFNAGYIAGLRGANVRYEMEGVIAHESVHLYQQFGGGLGFVEGMADAVRFKTGYFKITNRRRGGTWDAGYQTSGFFFAWLDDQYPPRFLIRLNAAQPKNAMTFMTLTGKSVDTLWADYQAAIP